MAHLQNWFVCYPLTLRPSSPGQKVQINPWPGLVRVGGVNKLLVAISFFRQHSNLEPSENILAEIAVVMKAQSQVTRLWSHPVGGN